MNKKASQNNLKRTLKHLVAFVLLMELVSSCIPNEKVVYMQNKELNPALDNDSLITLTRIDYRLQPNDILLINYYSRELDAVEKFYPVFVRLGSQSNNNSSNNIGSVNELIR